MSVQMSKVKLNFITYTSLMSSFAQVQQWRSSLVAFDNHGNNGGLCNSLTNAAINASRWCFSNYHVFPFPHYFSSPVLQKSPQVFKPHPKNGYPPVARGLRRVLIPPIGAWLLSTWPKRPGPVRRPKPPWSKRWKWPRWLIC